MKKLLSTHYSPHAFNAALLLFRISIGILMMHHGYQKLVHFGEQQTMFINFLGMGSTVSLALVVFAEFFCSMFLILGLFTRPAALALSICMAVALCKAHQYDVFKDGEKAVLYLSAYILILLLGPGKISVDSMTGK
jgi:putative oxidoreductase